MKRKAIKIIVGLLAVVGVLGIIAGGFIFYFVTQVDHKYTGQDLLRGLDESND